MAVTYDDNIIIESATYAADQSVRFKPPSSARACHIIIDVTDIHGPGTPEITPKVQFPDATGGWYTILTGTAISSVTTATLKIGLDYTAAADIAKEMVCEQMSLLVDHTDTDDIDYSVAVNWGQ